jgi:Dihydrofolate reductase
VEGLSIGEHASKIDRIFVIGGAAAYAEALKSETVVCDRVYLTKVFGTFDCDTKIPALDESLYGLASFEPRAKTEAGLEYQFRVYKNRKLHPAELKRSLRPAPLMLPPGRHEEMQYLDAIRCVLRARLS